MTRIDERAALLRTIAEDRHNSTPKLVLADWLEENDRHMEAARWRMEVASPSVLRVGHRTKYGGNGNGYGNGYGDGDGDGYDGNGNGYGNGGNGNGYDGYGGNGNGYCNKQKEVVVIDIGKTYLFMCPSWYVYAGRVADQIGPYEYVLENAIMVLNNGGHGWGGWASGKRSGSRVQRCGEGFMIGGPFAGVYPLVGGGLPLAGQDTFEVVTI